MHERTSIPQRGWGSKEKNKWSHWIIWIQAKTFLQPLNSKVNLITAYEL